MSPLVQYLNSQLKKILCLMTSYNHRHTLTIVIVAISDLKPKVDVNIHYLYLHSLSSKFTPSICAPWLHVLVLMLNRLKYLYNTPLLTVFFQDNYISKFVTHACIETQLWQWFTRQPTRLSWWLTGKYWNGIPGLSNITYWLPIENVHNFIVNDIRLHSDIDIT